MKKQKNKKTFPKMKLIIGFVIGFILIGIGVIGVQKARYYNDVANEANIVQIREFILLAVRGLKKDAPVDARSGDIYFPESKLYLPNPGNTLPLTYLFDSGDIANVQDGLSISTYPVRGTEALYTARTNTALFDAVPKLQACSRGIKVVYEKFSSNDSENILQYTVQLNNGRTAFIYLEKNCPELTETAKLFINMKSY